jgi:hypothetical protein
LLVGEVEAEGARLAAHPDPEDGHGDVALVRDRDDLLARRPDDGISEAEVVGDIDQRRRRRRTNCERACAERYGRERSKHPRDFRSKARRGQIPFRLVKALC